MNVFLADILFNGNLEITGKWFNYLIFSYINLPIVCFKSVTLNNGLAGLWITHTYDDTRILKWFIICWLTKNIEYVIQYKNSPTQENWKSIFTYDASSLKFSLCAISCGKSKNKSILFYTLDTNNMLSIHVLF